MLKEILKTLSVLLCAGALVASDDESAAATQPVITASFLTAADIANAELMTAAHEIVAVTPGFEHLVDTGKWGTHLTNIQTPRISPDTIRMMLFFKGTELKGVGAGGMMPLAVSPVYLDIPTTALNVDGTVTMPATVGLKFTNGQEIIAAQYRALVVSQGITPAESYNAGAPGSWSITNAFASTVSLAMAADCVGSDFVAMHSAFFEACTGKKLANGQTPVLHICTLTERGNADFSATSLQVYQGPFPYYPADKVRGQRAMLVGAYSDKPLP